ncbi:MAG: DUF4876 domain-containing protein [Gemmatimonadaceae bacterium]
MPDALSTRLLRCRSARLLALCLLLGAGLSVTACRQDVTEITGAKRPGDTTSTGGGGNSGGGGGSVQRATLTVTVGVAPEDTALARTLGLATGVLPGAEVTITRRGTASSRQTATADAAGVVKFAELLPGVYSVSVQRALAAAEAARLGAENADVTAFGGGGEILVEAPAASGRVEAVLGRRGSLVISEIYEYAPPTASFLTHPHGTYLELANNADTTIYLDRKVVGKVMEVSLRDLAPNFPCTETAKYRTDVAGLWTRALWQFPGAGREYPLAPGKAVILATDAIDHRVFNPGLLDLSGADFEFVGTAEDVDNPFVPNIIALGSDNGSIFGHGPEFRGIGPQVVFVGEPLDGPVTGLPQDRLRVTDQVFWRYPREKLLDVYSEWFAPGVFDESLPECQPMIHPDYDRRRAALGAIADAGAVRRRVFAVQADGRVILQRTRTSARDFERVPAPTPKQLP